MATQLNIVNDVLRRLREDEVNSVATSDYATLIAMFLNDAKEDLEDEWFWAVNEISIDTSITSDGTRTYDLTSTTDRSFLIRQINDQTPHAYDVTTNQNGQLMDIPLKRLQQVRDTYKGTVPNVEAPREFAITPDSDGRGDTLTLAQGATSTRTWRTYWYAPQAELALDGTADSTVIVLPERPLYLRTLYYALNERGEEMGEPGNVADQRATKAAAAAKEIDMQVQKKTNEKDMTNLEMLRNTLGGDDF
ncbi:hypothetical protein LCGC14_2981090 [marine sediment metagenome]|uniref:Uncharacterized protein n=1 Tax=marine sediment metagenome TaxID=412755 RepID=A0A0F8ZXT5_9ZZZZ